MCVSDLDYPLPIRWSDGKNYLLFNMLPGNPPHFNTTPDFYYGKVKPHPWPHPLPSSPYSHSLFLLLQAMLACAGFSPTNYRMGFDISIPVYNPLTRSEKLVEMATSRLVYIYLKLSFPECRVLTLSVVLWSFVTILLTLSEKIRILAEGQSY